LEQVISSTPKFAAPILSAYRELLESWGLVNAFRTSLFRGNFITESQIIPCGVLERSFYEILSNDLSRALSLISLREAFPEATTQVKYAIETNQQGPLFAMLRHPLDKCSEAILLLSSNEREVSRKLLYLHGDLANLFILYDCATRRPDRKDCSSWLLKKTHILPIGAYERLTHCSDLKQLTSFLQNTEFGRYLGDMLDSGPTEEFLERLKLNALRNKSRFALAGYPFRSATIMAALNLLLIEIANIMLCLTAVEGKISVENVSKFIVVP